MICKVQQTIDRYAMLQGATSVCAGVSGGMDSMCLLDLLVRLQPQYGFRLQVVHVNHLLRGENADRDALFVQQRCRDYGVPCTVVRADVAAISRARGIGREEAGRQVRYDAFFATGCDRIAVAHTLTDRIETSLFHLVRGTSPKGAAGIPPVRGNVIRPLIDCTRSDVEHYIQSLGLPFVSDESNDTDDYTRNLLRHHVLPVFRQINPSFEQSWARFLKTAAGQQDFLAAEAQQALARAKTENGYALSALQTLPPALLDQCVVLLLERNMQKMPEETHVALCCRAVLAGRGRVTVGDNLYFSVQNGAVSFETPAALPVPYCVTAVDGVFHTPHGDYYLCPPQPDDPVPPRRQLDGDKLRGVLTLRTRQPGDRFRYPDRQGTKTLKKLDNEQTLTPQMRASRAILCVDGEIAYLEGVGASQPFAAANSTTHRLVLQKKEDQA